MRWAWANTRRWPAATRMPRSSAACSSAANDHAHTSPTSRHRGVPPMDNDEVLRLLGRIERADEAAFRELYRAFSRRLYAYVLRQLGDPAQAEEIVADTLYEVWRR